MIRERLAQIRALFDSNKINGYIVPVTDEYLSEYVPAYAKRLEYMTGFNGSNGIAIILRDIVLFFTDGRYLTQSAKQLDTSYFIISDLAAISDFPWSQHIDSKHIIGYDPKLFTSKSIALFSGLNTRAIESNLVDQIWQNQPVRPNSAIYPFDIKFTGIDYIDKIAMCRKFIAENKADALAVTKPESVCWLFNIRAHDIEFSPLLLAYALITNDEAILFTDQERFNGVGQARPGIIIAPEADFAKNISEITGTILFDNDTCSLFTSRLLEQREHKQIKDPILLWKARKNDVEIDRMIKGHIQDAIAVCEFLSMIASTDLSNYTEYDLIRQLTSLRAKRENYVMDSFSTICGYQDNGAIIHYSAMRETAKRITGSGLLLIDSGGQYLGATTDITRTVAIGDSSEEYRRYYTNVLKGHIALGTVKFPAGKVAGAHLDALARQYLWSAGDDYAHGTGHGVGSFLSVHEGPQSISLSGYSAILAKGMVLSNEPGYYKPDHFGIRIENLMYVKETDRPNYLGFEMLTLVPYAKDLIDKTMLTDQEIDFIKQYYQKINQLIKPLLSSPAQQWLEKELSFIE